MRFFRWTVKPGVSLLVSGQGERLSTWRCLPLHAEPGGDDVPKPASLPAPIAANWQPHLALGITGHRASNASFRAHAPAIAAALTELFARIETIADSLPGARGAVRLHTQLVDGTDQIAAELALAQGWTLAVPLPFGAALNAALWIAASSTPQDVMPKAIQAFQLLASGLLENDNQFSVAAKL